MVKKIISILLIIIVLLIDIKEKSISNVNINNYFFTKFSKAKDMIAVLEIPNIKLKKNLYNKNSLYNTTNNIKILKESTMPDEDGNLILAGHSGNGEYAHFNNIKYLKINDIIIVNYKYKKYLYKINLIYEIKKTGRARINLKYTQNIVLITCIDSDKQLIVVANLINI